MDFTKKVIIIALILLAGYFVYKKYFEKEVQPLQEKIKNVDFFQTKINEKVQ